MRYILNKFIWLAALMFVFGAFAAATSAQRRWHRPPRVVIVRPFYSPFYDPFWGSRYNWRRNYRYEAERELAGNRRELEKHLAKYNADGVITAKEQRELDDDYKDVRNSEEAVRRYHAY